jgi:hypothetical protein
MVADMRTGKSLCLAVMLAVGVAMPEPGLHAQPVRDQVLAGAHVFEDAGCAVVRVSFNFPIRYQSHFPLAQGDELRIKLRPIVVSPDDRPGLFQRESLRAPRNRRAAIAKIIYEGDNVPGPVLTIFFRHPVAFKVGQGGDFRSLNIAISGQEPLDTCVPVFPS